MIVNLERMLTDERASKARLIGKMAELAPCGRRGIAFEIFKDAAGVFTRPYRFTATKGFRYYAIGATAWLPPNP